MSTSDLTFSISTNTGWPTGGVGVFYVVIDPGTSSEEKVLCTAQSTSVVTIQSGGRGADGSTAKAHLIGALTYPCWTAAEADELNAHANASTAVHGVAGAVVGTTDAQALTNKTIASASNTITVTGGAIDTVLAAKQASDATLTALAGLTATAGSVVQTAADTFTTRLLGVSGAGLTVNNPSGAAGDPTVVLTPGNITGIAPANITNVNGGTSLGNDVSTLKTRLDASETAPTLLIYTANGTITSAQAANAVAIRIRGCNGGGGSGGAGATAAGQSAASGPGAGGASAERIIATAGRTWPLQVNVGAGGTAGAATPTNGGVGGQSSVVDNNGAGATLWTPGVQTANQKGLTGAASNAIGDASTPGYEGFTTASTADFVVPGQPAIPPARYAVGNCTRQYGGNSMFGTGGLPGNGGAGTVGTGYGSGGGSSYLGPSTGTGVVGAAGTGGIVIAEMIY